MELSLSAVEPTPSTPPEPAPLSRRWRLGLAAIGLGVVLGVGFLLGAALTQPPDSGAEVGEEFRAEITAMNDRSICIAERPGDDDPPEAEGTCGLPILLDRDAGRPVEVGDTVRITPVLLTAPDGVVHEAWYVRPAE